MRASTTAPEADDKRIYRTREARVIAQFGHFVPEPEIIRAHGEDHEHGHPILEGRPQEQLDEGGSAVLRARLAHAKQLLELIDDHEQPLAGIEGTSGLDEAEALMSPPFRQRIVCPCSRDQATPNSLGAGPGLDAAGSEGQSLQLGELEAEQRNTGVCGPRIRGFRGEMNISRKNEMPSTSCLFGLKAIR